MSNFLKLIGEQIRMIRKQKGMTQEELGERAQLQSSYIGGIERGERNISLETLEKIIHALRVSPELVLKFGNIDPNIKRLDKNDLLDIHSALLADRKYEEILMVHRISKEIFSNIDSNKR
ncbi:helix-turn-helix domain-containing protein [Brevibacillus sp. 179-C9.3 HS]|uniref:helix-turn-helix domain-containing protein n=1 Tax=unclassified Brevibacillus TaxID=2684853 RepID=UPI00399F2466